MDKAAMMSSELKGLHRLTLVIPESKQHSKLLPGCQKHLFVHCQAALSPALLHHLPAPHRSWPHCKAI